ncbi:peptide chain release factor N(5)-glutamine methyltransferase [Thalassolituus oleivorans]|uniref:peptide chain release factor N(5)-glutamine methyltransferase n=1 Tax=Thalassolituus oleivorans TaxID=187493 RepID=UPI002409EBE0|nr:peptide chain release factor N(5)-glutamine methyltransferase [Thalassolituus oleivorans]MDF1640419.1 peptide chain release factor N(5)-glutamine methyltransferase [Thalassolituus oleivorans]
MTTPKISSSTNLPTIEAWITDAREQLDEHTESPRLDAELILGHVLDKDRTYLYTWGDRLLTVEHCLTADTLLQRRLLGEPIAYVLGEREFWSLMLDVAPSTLIPRPDTETLVEWALNLALPHEAKVIDLGTGTGAIALALASEKPTWVISGVDFNPEAVALAQRNALKTQLTVTFKQSSWFSAVQGTYDLIVSNPPYIDSVDPHLSQGDVRFEPRTALVADDQGMADIYTIVQQAPRFLNLQGWLLLEHGFEQADAVCNALRARGFTEVETQLDLAGQPRISGGRWLGDD